MEKKDAEPPAEIPFLPFEVWRQALVLSEEGERRLQTHGLSEGRKVEALSLKALARLAARYKTDLRISIVVMQRAEALKYLEAAMAHQRALRAFHVQELAEEMLKGTFVPCTVLLYHTTDEGTLLLDAHHRLQALCVADLHVPGIPVCMIVVERSNVTAQEAREDYRRVDIGLIRSLLDKLRMGRESEEYALASESLALLDKLGLAPENGMQTIPPASRAFIGKGAQIVEMGLRYYLFTKDAIASHAADELEAAAARWAEEGAVYLALIRGLKKYLGALKSKHVVAIALATLRHEPELAVEFWRNVAHDSGEGGDPARALCERIRETNQWRGHSVEEQMAIVTHAWNAHWSNISLEFIRLNKGVTATIPLKGTGLAVRRPAAFRLRAVPDA